MKTLLFIYNTASGKGRISAELSVVLDTFTKTGYLVTSYPTQTKGDAARIARELGGGFDRVVCAGGDGTLSETVSGLLALENPPVVGYIPMGSTNDCARNLQLPKDTRKSAMIAAEGFPRPWDIGVLNGRPFVYVAAFGAFTEVTYETPQDLKKTFGHLAYIAAGIASIPSISPYHMDIEYDGKRLSGDFFYGMICNTLSVGGLFSLPADRVAMDDGLFEVVLVKRPINLAELIAGLQALIMQNEVEEGSAFLSFRASEIKLTSNISIPWTLDGEYGGNFRTNKIKNHSKAIEIVQGKET